MRGCAFVLSNLLKNGGGLYFTMSFTTGVLVTLVLIGIAAAVLIWIDRRTRPRR